MIKKADIILTAVILAAVLLSVGMFAAFGKNGKYCTVTSDGTIIGSYPLEKNIEFSIPYGDGYNKIVIKNGSVNVSEASCRDGICVKHSSISKVGESIVCLPNKLVVEIKEDANG